MMRLKGQMTVVTQINIAKSFRPACGIFYRNQNIKGPAIHQLHPKPIFILNVDQMEGTFIRIICESKFVFLVFQVDQSP